MTLFSKIGRLFRQMVSWFRPDEGGSFVHRLIYEDEPPRSGGVPRPPAPRPKPMPMPPTPVPQPPAPPIGVIGAVEASKAAGIWSGAATPAPEHSFVIDREQWIGRPRPHHRGDPKPTGVAVIDNADAAWEAYPEALQCGDDPPEAPQRENRNLRRAKAAYERARRKHDKFVEPEGPVPIPISMRPDSPAPRKEVRKVQEPDQFDDPNDRIIVDEWLEGSGDKVLFEGSEFYGEFNFRDTILDQLDRYWVYLDRMRRHDRDAYAFYKTLGARLVPYSATSTRTVKPWKLHKYTKEERAKYMSQCELPPWFREKWPAFGCVAFGTNPVDEQMETTKIEGHGGYLSTPKFMYFRKLKRSPWTVQPVLYGKVYSLTVWWDRALDKKRPWKWGRPHEFPIHISNDGKTITVLKTRMRSNGDIGPWWDWRIPHEYEEWSKQYGLDAQSHLAHTFVDCVKHCEFADYSMLLVDVAKGNMHAKFGLDPHRTPYFFQDRDIVLTAKGRKRRIFHMVRPFIDKHGKAHPMSFRGLKEFHWAGYDVTITVPGRDHFMLSEFDVASWSDPVKRPGERWSSEGETAEYLARQMRRGLQ